MLQLLNKDVGQMNMGSTGLFTDGEAYERMMGRWSRVVGEAFLAPAQDNERLGGASKSKISSFDCCRWIVAINPFDRLERPIGAPGRHVGVSRDLLRTIRQMKTNLVVSCQ